ncbi:MULTISPECIES: hypothetical protein [unclassified Archaeoglobus]|jgi:hypothetical protein|uniref:hypothetical protein n=1 Tax=unclassified Archaeoglobus TaxID=2643606 RepID=UPI0025C204E3|nr:MULTISPECIES: hypothetical protein [unclassified Archaeoglobus]
MKLNRESEDAERYNKIEEIVDEDIKRAIEEEFRRSLVRIPLLILRRYLLNLSEVEKIKVRRTGEPSKAMILFLKNLKLGVNDVRAIISDGEVAESLRNLKSSIDDVMKINEGNKFREVVKIKAMLPDNDGVEKLRTVCRRFLREIAYFVLRDVYYMALSDPKGFEQAYSRAAIDIILDRIEMLLKALSRVSIRSADSETEKLYKQLLKIALGEKDRILPPPDIYYSTTNKMYDRLVGIVRRLLLEANIPKYELPKYIRTDDLSKTITIGIPIGDGYDVVTIKFTERRWYVPPSKAEQHVRSALKAQREALNSRDFAVWPDSVRETCIILVGSRYTRSVARKMKKKFENPPRRRVYVFTDYKWLYRLVKVLYRFFLSRLEGLNKRLEEVKIKAYGVVKDMYELFMAYVDTLSRWLRRVKFVGSVLVYPD